MGYKLLYDKQILFDVYSGDYVTDARLSMSVNAVSYFDFTISLTHSLYGIVAEHAGIVELYFDDAKLFSGEITEISVDLNGNKDITCAGALDYLSYTLVRPYSTIDGEADLLAPSSVDGYFNWLIEQHNKHCLDSRKHFFVGVNQGNLLDNNNYIYRASSELPTTSSEIENKILNSIGGYLYVRYKDDKNILDLYADTHEANTQIIDFGVNITDFVKTTSTDDQYTAVIATGYTPDPPEDDPQKKMNPITLEGCVDGGTPYSPSIVKMGDVVYDVNAVARYGYKEYHVSNDDIKTYDGLLQYACKVLNKLLSPSLSVSVKAVDLSLYMKDKYEHMQVGQAVRVRSKLHNIDEYLVVNSITLDMNNPENTEYQLGESYDTLTGQQSSYLRSLNSSIVSNLDSVAKLDSETKKNAKDITDTKASLSVTSECLSASITKAQQTADGAVNAASNAQQTADAININLTKNYQTTKDADDKYATQTSLNATAESITSTVSKTYATKTEVNQTATDLTTTITTAQNAANDAKGAAESAQTTANEAKGTADSAKTSTNVLETLIRQSGDGVEVAKKVNDEYTSTKTLMGPDGFYIKDLADTALTQVKSDSIILGKETKPHIHINPDNVTMFDGNEKELAKFYKNGVSLSSNDLIIRSPIESDPITDIGTIGGFNIHSVLDDRFQSIVPIHNNNTCSIEGTSDVYNKPLIGENITTITVAESTIVIKARANAKGTDTTADSKASISIGAVSSVYNSDSFVDNASNITIDANIIQLRAKDRLDIKGKTLKDFVTDFGTSTTTDSLWPNRTWDWRWIKTYSGKCFAWGECGFNIICTTAWGSGYYDHVCPVYPFKLSKWNVQASASFIGGGIGLTGIYDDSATQCPIYIWSAVYQNTGTMFVKVFVEGVLA